MAQVVAKVPFDTTEAELLSSGVPRGYKQLTTATSKLVKAGWLVKVRNGWTATEEGVRALAAFPDAEAFSDAMASGKPVPEPKPVEGQGPKSAAGQVQEELPVHVQQVPEQVQEDPSPASAHVFDSGDQDEDPAQPALVEEDLVVPEAPASDVVAPAEQAPVDGGQAPNDAWQDQPQSVALAGDFNPLFGEAGHWTTNLHGLQLDYDAVENIWKQTLQLPAGTYQYKIVVNGSWDENYGAYGVRDGANHELRLLSDTAVTFRFDYATKDIETS